MHDSDATPPIDERIAALAARQDDLFSTPQLKELGVTRSQASDRVLSGRWRRIHPGVYTTSHAPLSWRQRLRAALLAAGPDAAASHLSAARLHNVRRSERIHITCGTKRRLHGVTTHRSASARTTVIDGLRVTTIERTLLDLATLLDRHDLQKAVHEADFHQLLDVAALDAQLRSGHHGARRLAAALEDYQPDATDTDEGAAEALLRLIEAHGIERPQTKRLVAGHEADFYWPAHDLVVEVDGKRAHLNHRAFERDRRRDGDMLAAGIKVLRLTGRRIDREGDAVAALLGRLTR